MNPNPSERSTTRPDAASLLNRFVHVEFMKFIPVDRQGRERNAVPAFGYIVYNGANREFGSRNFWESDSYTIEDDVWDHIREHHAGLAADCIETGGFYLCGHWQALQGTNDVVH